MSAPSDEPLRRSGYLDAINRAAEEVAKWPDWKRVAHGLPALEKSPTQKRIELLEGLLREVNSTWEGDTVLYIKDWGEDDWLARRDAALKEDS